MLIGGNMPYFLINVFWSFFSVLCASSEFVRDILKCVHPLNKVSPLCVLSLERMHLSLLPIYRTSSPVALPTSYTPDIPCFIAFIVCRLKGLHFVLSGISRLPIFRLFYTQLPIDSNYLSMLTLAKKLGRRICADAIEITRMDYSMQWGTG